MDQSELPPLPKEALEFNPNQPDDEFQLIEATTPEQMVEYELVLQKVYVEEFGIAQESIQDRKGMNRYFVFYKWNQNKEQKPVAIGTSRYTLGEYLRIREIALLKEYRGRGLGYQMVKKTIDVVKAHNINNLIIHSTVNIRLRKFYEKLGYVVDSDNVFHQSEINRDNACNAYIYPD